MQSSPDVVRARITLARLWPAMIVLGLPACAPLRPPPAAPKPPPQARVNYQAVPDKQLKHYAIMPSQTAIAPDPRPDNPAPAYPPDLVARALPPVSVTALLIVGAKGRVQAVRIAGEASDGPLQQRFDAAVRTAALKWRFEPFQIANWVTDANGDEHRVDTTPKPFSQTYRFTFRVLDGKPQVSSGLPPAQR